MVEEFKLIKDIDIKFTRISKPSLNILDVPLSGLYNDINNIESSKFPLKNKFKNFCISSPDCLGLENLFQLNSSFGKILTEEKLEGLIILTNISKREVTIVNLEITVKCEDEKKEKGKSSEIPEKTYSIPLNGNNNSLLLFPNKSYSIKIDFNLKYTGKNIIKVNFRTKCPYYTQQYYFIKQRNRIKENNEIFILNKENQIEFVQKKNFSFQVNHPFIIKENFRFNKMKEEYFIVINIKNQSKYTLTLPDLIIMPKTRNNIILKPLINIQEIQNTENKYELGGIENTSKILCLQPEEEVNVFFKSNSSELFLNEEKFILYIKWLNLFDFSPKNFEYEFKNGLELFNEFFILKIDERPLGNIIQNTNFHVSFQIISKQPEKNYSIIIAEYKNNQTSNHKSKTNERDMIDYNNNINITIQQYKIEINKNSPKSSVDIICKSEKLGIVSFPKIIIQLFEGENANKKKVQEYIYKDLLVFNCVQNAQLI